MASKEKQKSDPRRRGGIPIQTGIFNGSGHDSLRVASPGHLGPCCRARVGHFQSRSLRRSKSNEYTPGQFHCQRIAKLRQRTQWEVEPRKTQWGWWTGGLLSAPTPLYGDVSFFLASPVRGPVTNPGVPALFATESARTHAVVRERMSLGPRRTVRGMGAVPENTGDIAQGLILHRPAELEKWRVSAGCLSPRAIGCGSEILARPPTPLPTAHALKVLAASEWRCSA